MVTCGRPKLLQESVRCYLKQTYANKELIILSQGSVEINKEIQDYLKLVDRDDIQFVSCSKSLSLGAMRNLSIELTTGSIVCQWDDDDLYHPLRIQTQLNAVMGSGVSASLYQQHLKYFADTKELYWVDWEGMPREFERYLCGSIMFHKKYFHAVNNLLYPETPREEDLDALKKLMNFGRIAPITHGNQYIYVYHGSNTYWREHHSLVLEKRVFSKHELMDRRLDLEHTFAEVGLKTAVVRSLCETAFNYEGIA